MLSKMIAKSRTFVLELKLTHKAVRLGSTVARLELKGIDGDLYKWWSM